MTQFRNLTLLLALLLCMGIQGQITIGSTTPPLTGALLDLKENDSPTGGNTSSKGLNLPRVKLLHTSIQTGESLAQTVNGNSTTANWDKDEHIGLTVYHVSGITPKECANIKDGLYTWDGDKWQYLQEVRSSPDVHYEADGRDGDVYPYRKFGNAGEWMLENMRYVDVAMTAKAGGGTATDKYYTYPNGDPANPGTAPTTWSAAQGLLYSYSAATLGVQDGINVDQGQVAGATPGPNEVENTGPLGTAPHKYVQGICPAGWHIPSDREWNELEKELYDHADTYSSYTAADLPFTAIYNAPINTLSGWQADWESGLAFNSPPTTIGGYASRGSTSGNGHGLAIQSICAVPNSPYGATGGKSVSATQGGFNALLPGIALNGLVVNYGYESYLWAASIQGYNSTWVRNLGSQYSQVFRTNSNLDKLLSVRCKKNDH